MNLQDSLFIEQVEEDVTFFSQNTQPKRVLVFPPVNNYRRFLIHQLIHHQFSNLLYTFSIGQLATRRTVVCCKFDLIRHPKLNAHLSSEKSGVGSSTSNMVVERPCLLSTSPENIRPKRGKSTSAIEIYRPPAVRKVKNNLSNVSGSIPLKVSAQRPKEKRPDRAVYVPKHRRSIESDGSQFSHHDCSPVKSKNNSERKVSWNEKNSIEKCPSNQGNNQSIEVTNTVPGDSVQLSSLNNVKDFSNTIIKTLETIVTDGSDKCNNENNRSEDNGDQLNATKNNFIGRDCYSDIKTCKKASEKKTDSDSRNAVSNNVLIISTNDTKTQNNLERNMPAKTIISPEKKIKKISRTKSKAASPPSLPTKFNRDECDWDSLFDDNGECLDPTLIDELTEAVGQVTIQLPKNDYKAFSRSVEISNDEFAHVVEIYNFPSDYKTSDLAAVFTPWKNGGFELKWVDDTHCLGVFSSPLVAAEVLASNHPFVKTRPMSEATALSKTKAKKSAEFLQPYKSRPETCAALARRLVTGALGVRLATARQEREHEKILIREAKERRRLANKQREDVWEGIIAHK